MWLPNIILGLGRHGADSAARGGSRARVLAAVGEGGGRLLRRAARDVSGGQDVSGAAAKRESVVTVSAGSLPGVNILDWYVTKMYLRWVGLAFVGLLGIFYIATFIDLSDKLFKEETTGAMLLRYFWHRDAAVRLLRPADRGTRGDAGDHRSADQDKRAHRDEGVRDQPVSGGVPDSLLQPRLERLVVRAGRDGARSGESNRRGP